MPAPNILLVEDNPQYLAAAQDYLVNHNAIVSAIACDYETAMQHLESLQLDGALIDCFFRRQKDSNDISLGERVVTMAQHRDPVEQRVLAYEQAFANQIELDDELRGYVRNFAITTREQNPEKNHTFKAVERASRVVGKPAATIIARNSIKTIFSQTPPSYKDYYTILRQAMQQDPSNQPLGILVAEEAKQRRIPLVMVTSTYHHDTLTQPIANYCSRRGCPLIDCYKDSPHHKATPEFWERAYGELKMKIKGDK